MGRPTGVAHLYAKTYCVQRKQIIKYGIKQFSRCTEYGRQILATMMRKERSCQTKDSSVVSADMLVDSFNARVVLIVSAQRVNHRGQGAIMKAKQLAQYIPSLLKLFRTKEQRTSRDMSSITGHRCPADAVNDLKGIGLDLVSVGHVPDNKKIKLYMWANIDKWDGNENAS